MPRRADLVPPRRQQAAAEGRRTIPPTISWLSSKMLKNAGLELFTILRAGRTRPDPRHLNDA
jgi:hypothetical protein